MNWKKYTVIFILALFLIVALYDVLAISQAGTEASISHTMIVWAYHFPLFPFLMGILAGHLFWRMHDTPETEKISKDNFGS